MKNNDENIIFGNVKVNNCDLCHLQNNFIPNFQKEVRTKKYENFSSKRTKKVLKKKKDVPPLATRQAQTNYLLHVSSVIVKINQKNQL